MQAVRVTPKAGEWKFKRRIDNFTKVIQDLHGQQYGNAGGFLRSIVKLTRYNEFINESTITSSAIPVEIRNCRETVRNGK